MAYQPTNPHPYMETIDATNNNQFSCQISDRDIVTGATIQIFNEQGELSNYVEDLKSVFVFTSGYLSISDPAQITEGVKTTIRLKLKEYMNNGYTLGVIDDKGNLCKITKVSRSAPSTTYIYVKGSFTKDNDYKVYSDAPVEVVVPEEELSTSNPIYGGNLDKSVFSYTVESNKLQNGVDYSWNVTFNLNEENHISSGKVNKMSADYTSVYIPYSASSLERLNNCDLNHVYISLYNPQKHLTVDLKLDPGKDVDAIADAMLVVYVEALTDEQYEQKDQLGILDTSVENFGSHLLYRLYEGNITLTTPKYYFKTRQTPELILDDVPSTIFSCEYTFSAKYYQNDGTQFAYYQFDLYQDGNLIDSSGQQTSRLIQYTFKSFMNQSKYEIVLTVVNDENVETVARQSFYVDYTLLNFTIAPAIESDNTNACIKIDYSNQAEIPGKASKEGAVSFIDGGIHLTQNETILWDERNGKPLDIPSSSTQVIRWHGDHGFQGKIAEVYDSVFPWGSVVVSFDGTRFTATEHSAPVTINGNTNGAWGVYDETVEASAIAGRDTYSAFCGAATYTASDSTITIMEDITDIIVPGNWVQIENYHCKIKSVKEGIITLDRPLPQSLLANLSTGDNGAHYTFNFSVYNENYIYEINDTDELTDTDILIDNDQVNKYWWLIIINPEGSENRVEIRKSALYTESEV